MVASAYRVRCYGALLNPLGLLHPYYKTYERAWQTLVLLVRHQSTGMGERLYVVGTVRLDIDICNMVYRTSH